MFTGLVEAPVCVYCDTLLYLDDRLVPTGAEEDKEENEQIQSVGPEDGPSSVTQNGEKDVPYTLWNNLLYLDKMWGFHDSENLYDVLSSCVTMCSDNWTLIFCRNPLPPSSGYNCTSHKVRLVTTFETRWHSWLRHCTTSQKVGCRFNSWWCHWNFSLTTLCPILPPSCADCLEIWVLHLLEPSGPVQACTGLDGLWS